TLLLQQDLIYKDNKVSVFINSFWIKNNQGHAIVVTNEHYENIYDLPNVIGTHIFAIAKKVAVAMRESYQCSGITTLQNNEPIGGQHAFHFHLHIFPRYKNDDLHLNMMNKKLANSKERLKYANKLKI